MRFSEHEKLHQKKGDQRGRGNGEDLGDQNIVRDRGQGELDGSDRCQPTGDHHREVLHQLAKVIASPALKDPEFVEQKMAGYPDKVSD